MTAECEDCSTPTRHVTHDTGAFCPQRCRLTNADEVRTHLQFLMAHGMSLAYISERSGITKQHLSRLHLGTTPRVRPHTAMKVLGIGTHMRPWAPRARHERCRSCETTNRRHLGHGLCERCYWHARRAV